MIRDLRRRHRRIILVLGLLVPVTFAIGIAARKNIPVNDIVAMDAAHSSPQFDSLQWERTGLFTNSSIIVRLRREQKASGSYALQLIAPKDFLKPDLLVYWVGGAPPINDKLPEKALLLGAFISGVSIPVPPGALSTDSVLVLYSLVDQEIVDVSKPISIR